MDKRVIHNDYALSLFNKIYSILIGVVSSAFYIRYLGVQYKGTYSYINEIANILGLILNFGIYQSYPFYYRKYGRSIYDKYVGIFIKQFLLYSILFSSIATLLHADETIFLIFIQISALVLKTQLDNVILVERLPLYMWADMAVKTVLALLYFLLWKFAPVHVSYVVFSVLLTNLAVSIAYLLATHVKISKVWNAATKDFTKEVIVFGFYPMLSALLMTLNYSVDIIFLRFMCDTRQLSLYSVAAVIINYVWIIPNAFKEVLTSRIAREDSDERVAASCRISLLITAVIFIGFALLGRLAIRIVFGEDFLGCYGVTLVLFIGAFSMIFFKMLGVVFVAEGRQKEYFVILLISVIANVIANSLLIPIWGMYGAAIASVASYSVCGFTFLRRYCTWKNTNLKRYIFNKNDINVLKNIIRRRK